MRRQRLLNNINETGRWKFNGKKRITTPQARDSVTFCSSSARLITHVVTDDGTLWNQMKVFTLLQAVLGGVSRTAWDFSLKSMCPAPLSGGSGDKVVTHDCLTAILYAVEVLQVFENAPRLASALAQYVRVHVSTCTCVIC